MAAEKEQQGFLVTFNTNFVAPLLLIVSGVSAFFSNQAAQSADQARQFAETESLQRATDRADRALDRDYQFKIAELTLASIETNNSAKQRALLVIVQTLPEPMGPQMVKALSFSEDSAVATDAKRVLAATQDFQAVSDTPAAAPKGAPPAAVARPAQAPVTNSQLLASGAAKGWDVDVFWCQGSPGEPVLYARASNLAEKLAAVARAKDRIGDTQLGRIRLRPISMLTNNGAGYRIYSDVIRAEASEVETAQQLRAFSGSIGEPLTVSSSRKKTPFYLSVFFCGATA